MGQGGGVDIVSFEFPRPLTTAPWNTDGRFKEHGTKEKTPISLVNADDGKISPVRKMVLKTRWNPKTEKLEPDAQDFEFTGEDVVKFNRWALKNDDKYREEFKDFVKEKLLK